MQFKHILLLIFRFIFFTFNVSSHFLLNFITAAQEYPVDFIYAVNFICTAETMNARILRLRRLRGFIFSVLQET